MPKISHPLSESERILFHANYKYMWDKISTTYFAVLRSKTPPSAKIDEKKLPSYAICAKCNNDESYSLTFHFSLYPFVITFLYFLFTFLFSSFRSIKIIQKSQPQDLLQYDSPHKIPSSVLILRAKLLFPASIICITLSAIFFLLQPLSESANFTFGTLFSILFIYLFFHYFPAWIFDWLEKGSWKYHSVCLLVLRAFTARINDMSNSFLQYLPLINP